MSKSRFTIDVAIEFDRSAGQSTPAQVHLDFDRLLGTAVSKGLIDPHTIIVRRRLDGKERRYSVQFEETLYYRNQGWVAWLVDNPQAGGQWSLEFGLRAQNGRLAKAPYKPLVGVGDEIHYNGRRWHPINVPGMHTYPIAVDWDGDGLIDILSSSHYANTYAMPSSGVFFWRNIGTNAQPRFGTPMRLYADGVNQKNRFAETERFRPRRDFISEFYLKCDVFDWFGSGRSDLITCSKTGGIRVYRNLGELDATGLPMLELAQRIRPPSCLAPIAFYKSVRAVDWDGSGRPSLILGSMHALKQNWQLVGRFEQMVLMLNVGGSARRGWKFKTVPLAIAGGKIAPDTRKRKDWRTFSNFSGGRSYSYDVYDIDGDGRLELLCCHVGHLSGPVIDVWRNAGTLAKPAMMYDKILPWSSQYKGFGFRFVRDKAFNGCLLGSSTGIHYFKKTRNDPFDPKSFRDMGPLLGEGCKLKLEGFVRPCPLDVDGKGNMSLLCGDEPGFLTLVRNIGSRNRTVFARPKKITDRSGHVLRLNRESIIPDNDGEGNCGQLKPFVCDWDGDGNLDIIVAGNTNRILWLDHYDPETNSIRRMHELKVKGLVDPFAARKGPCVIDFDGDGRPELLAVNSLRQICLYRQGRGTQGRIVLEPPILLKYRDGRPLGTWSILSPGMAKKIREPNVCLAACDWTGTGSYDLIVSSYLQTFLLENVGSNRSPRFKRPKPLCQPDGTPVEISHHESHVAVYDWDRDGRLDLMIGGESGTIYLLHRDWITGVGSKIQLKGMRQCAK